jgi:hypothetical protein
MLICFLHVKVIIHYECINPKQTSREVFCLKFWNIYGDDLVGKDEIFCQTSGFIMRTHLSHSSFSKTISVQKATCVGKFIVINWLGLLLLSCSRKDESPSKCFILNYFRIFRGM